MLGMNEDQLQIVATYDGLFKNYKDKDKDKDYRLAAMDLCTALNMEVDEAEIAIESVFKDFQMRQSLSIYRRQVIWGPEAMERSLGIQVALATGDNAGLEGTFLEERLYDSKNPIGTKDVDRAVRFLTSAPQHRLFNPADKQGNTDNKVEVNIINANTAQALPESAPTLPIHGQFPAKAFENRIARNTLPGTIDDMPDFDRAIDISEK